MRLKVKTTISDKMGPVPLSCNAVETSVRKIPPKSQFLCNLGPLAAQFAHLMSCLQNAYYVSQKLGEPVRLRMGTTERPNTHQQEGNWGLLAVESTSGRRRRRRREKEEEGPLTQMEGDTFGVAGDGRWWEERRADGKEKKITCNVFIMDARLPTCAGAVGGGRGRIPKVVVGNNVF